MRELVLRGGYHDAKFLGDPEGTKAIHTLTARGDQTYVLTDEVDEEGRRIFEARPEHVLRK